MFHYPCEIHGFHNGTVYSLIRTSVADMKVTFTKTTVYFLIS